MDPNSIMIAVKGLKAASSIAKALINSGPTLEKAEMKLQLADLVEALANARLAERRHGY